MRIWSQISEHKFRTTFFHFAVLMEFCAARVQEHPHIEILLTRGTKMDSEINAAP